MVLFQSAYGRGPPNERRRKGEKLLHLAIDGSAVGPGKAPMQLNSHRFRRFLASCEHATSVQAPDALFPRARQKGGDADY